MAPGLRVGLARGYGGVTVESLIIQSWRHHKDRLNRAVDRKDHSAMRDAQTALRDLEARLLPAERRALGLAES